MNEILALLFLICITTVGIRLAVTGSIEWKALSSLLLFGLFAAFIIARFKDIQWLGISKDVGVKTFQTQVDAIKSDAISKIESEIDAQKNSLRLVIADANTTREKLSEQQHSLEAVYEKTKKMETRLDDQKKDIEKTIERSSLAEQEIQAAQSVLTQLGAEIKTADEKLKLLAEKTASITVLPDGRLKLGNFITGDATVLKSLAERLDKTLESKNYSEGFGIATKMLEMIEKSEDAEKGVGISTASLNKPWVARVYHVGSDCARITGKTNIAIKWAKKSIDIENNGARRAALVLCLLTANENSEAQKVIQETKAMDAKTFQEFREVLKRVGLEIPE